MFCHNIPCCFAIAWAIEVLVRRSGLCSVARCAIIPLCRFASPVNLFLFVLKVSNMAMVVFSSFTQLSPGMLVKTSVIILICWSMIINSWQDANVKCNNEQSKPNIAQHLFIDPSLSYGGGNEGQDNSLGRH